MERISTRQRLAAGVIVLVLVVWWCWPSDQLVKVESLRAEMRSDAAKSWSPEVREQKRGELRTAMDRLTPAEKTQMSAGRQKRFEEQMVKYTTMTPAEKTQFLDQQINQMEQQTKAMSKGTSAKQPQSNAPSTKSPPSNEDRERRRQQMLDATTPQARAAMDVYRRDMGLRRQQRGLPPRTNFGR